MALYRRPGRHLQDSYLKDLMEAGSASRPWVPVLREGTRRRTTAYII
jgi:hypothetical protein